MEKIWYQSYPESMARDVNPDQYRSLGDFFEKSCARYASKKAVSNMGTSITYSALEEKTRHFASYLQNVLHLNKGDRIGIMLPNCLQYYVVMFAALRAGLIVVNINPQYTSRELLQQLTDSGAETVVVLANFAHTVEEALREIKLKHVILTELGDLFPFPKGSLINFAVKYIKKIVPFFSLSDAIPFKQTLQQGALQPFRPVEVSLEDIAFLQYTGGTTGVSKGAILTHRNIVANVLQMLTWVDGTLELGKEISVLPLPLYHIFTLTCGCFVMMASGAESILITNPRDIPHFIKELHGIKFTLIFSINTLCNALLHNERFAKLDFSALKFTIVGGMAATLNVAERWQEVTGVHILEGYGLTETSPVVTINSFHGTAFTGGIGIPIPGTDVEIRDGEGKPVPLGEEGELCVRGPQVMKSYWNNPEETRLVFSADGWLCTGDMASIDDKGLITLVDRKKDMIIVSGFKVYPNEVEAVLMSHPGIIEAAVIGIPQDEGAGEQVKAFVVRRDINLSKEDIILHCRRQLTPYKVPHIIEFREELPKSPVGKILRRVLREKKLERLKKAA